MFRQYFKQAIQMLKENRLTSVISILGTALISWGYGQIHGIVKPGIRPPCPMVS